MIKNKYTVTLLDSLVVAAVAHNSNNHNHPRHNNSSQYKI